MRVALLSYNAQLHNAVGNLVAERVRFFLDRGAAVRLFVQDARKLHPDLRAVSVEVPVPHTDGAAWDFLRQADLVQAIYAQHYDLLQWLPCLAGGTPRIVLEYVGVTPPHLWPDQHRELLETSLRCRGYVWCADRALASSDFIRQELLGATGFPQEQVAILPLSADEERFSAEPPERFLQQKLGIAGRILLYVGRLAGNKRAPLLIKALARLNDRSLHAVLLGDQSDVYAAEAQRCRELASELGVAERVHFMDPLADADLPRAYRSAAVLVMPSLHEGFCVPVIEAMASGVPVIASRSAALPETLGDAGLTFTPNDAEDLARQLRRVLGDTPVEFSSASSGREERCKQVPDAEPPSLAQFPHGVGNPRHSVPRRVAIVCFRFGREIVGGAETSLRTMASALRDAGQHVEVFTTCTSSESHWRNDLPAGTFALNDLTVHRFPIDPHDADAHGRTYRQILDAATRGDSLPTPLSADRECRYLAQSIHSSALLNALSARQHEFDAIITGPYLFGLTSDIVKSFTHKTLLAPCFHDEPLARLALWPILYSDVGGILYHSAEEQAFAQMQLGVNHPNAWQVGTCLTSATVASLPRAEAATDRHYLVYGGRYSEAKNVPLLLDWMRRYQAERPGRLDLVFFGRGDQPLPDEPWLRDAGQVDEATKRRLLAGARALVQLSAHESLSIVVLEAWAEGTPVVVHRDCAVLVGQVERARGGAAVGTYPAFADTLDDLCARPADWKLRGAAGRAHVHEHYASPRDYVARLLGAIEQMRLPLREQMRARGLARAREFSRVGFQKRFAAIVDQVLTQPARPRREDPRVEPLRTECRVAAGVKTLLVPVRFTNAGTHAVASEGPGRTVVCVGICDGDSQREVVDRQEIGLRALLMPGQSQVAALPVTVPSAVGAYRLLLGMARHGGASRVRFDDAALPLIVVPPTEKSSAHCTAPFLDTIQATLPRTQELAELPDDYVDVTEGRFASAKRFIKRKLLNNFKQGYVDVLSRRQSQVNGQLVLMVQQLTECCTMLEHAVGGLHQRLDALEEKMERWRNDAPRPACRDASSREKKEVHK